MSRRHRSAAWAVVATTVVAAAVLAAGTARQNGPGQNGSGQPGSGRQPYTTWRDYGGSADGMQYSALAQIDKTNVGTLAPTWSYLAPGPSGRFAFNPLIVGETMFVVGKDSAVVALDAASGRLIWSRAMEDTPTNRGFNYWESADGADRRIIFAVNSYLREIDARTGEPIASFGRNGRVDLRAGLPRANNIQSGTPGRVFENLIILGSATGEGYGSPPGDIRAFDVRTGALVWTFHTIPRPGEFGYDTWPADAWQYAGGANVWGEISIDEARGIAYFPTGSPTFDLYGGDRHGANLFGNCLLALDARTGKRLWHQQLVHHDLWDYDLVAAPKLLTVRHQGRIVDVVAQATKTGMLYVYDRVTGAPIWPIEERPVPKSDVPGEESWPTQPFPTRPLPFARQTFAADDLNPFVDAAERARLREQLLAARNEGIYTPPSLSRPFIVVPGQNGGANFGAAAGDPRRGRVYVRSEDLPTIHQLREWNPSTTIQVDGETPAERGLSAYAQLCTGCHGPAERDAIRSVDRATLIRVAALGRERVTRAIRQGQGQMPAFAETLLSSRTLDALLTYLENPAAAPGPARIPPPLALSKDVVRYTGPLGSAFRASNGLPAIGPPWARLVAYDLNEGTTLWDAPLGTVPALVAQGHTRTGNATRIHRNGVVATAGGLLFVGSYGDRTVRAYDADSGAILWSHQLRGNPEGLPAVYEVGGRQHIAFFASASPTEGSPGSNVGLTAAEAGAQGYYVFALK
jgi:quinoprotein glucose dehydrogenase